MESRKSLVLSLFVILAFAFGCGDDDKPVGEDARVDVGTTKDATSGQAFDLDGTWDIKDSSGAVNATFTVGADKFKVTEVSADQTNEGHIVDYSKSGDVEKIEGSQGGTNGIKEFTNAFTAAAVDSGIIKLPIGGERTVSLGADSCSSNIQKDSISVTCDWNGIVGVLGSVEQGLKATQTTAGTGLFGEMSGTWTFSRADATDATCSATINDSSVVIDCNALKDKAGYEEYEGSVTLTFADGLISIMTSGGGEMSVVRR